jgi:ferric-dicitrate binding protein FerR (iron transport regulator)
MTPEHPRPSGWIDLEITASDPAGGGLANPPAPSAASPRPVSRRTVIVAVTVATLALAVAIFGLVVRSRTVTRTTHIQAVARSRCFRLPGRSDLPGLVRS